MSKIVVSTFKLKNLVNNAIDEFIIKDRILLQRGLSERALCGALMKRFYDVLNSKGYEELKNYFVDVEFNRHSVYKINTYINKKKRIVYEEKLIDIFTDIIIHGRGVLDSCLPDNLIAIEMKKKLRDTDCYNLEYNPLKNIDFERLKYLTLNEEEFQGAKCYKALNGKENLYAYAYQLGVFIEIDYKKVSVKSNT